jgi:MFS family permease
MTKFAGSALTGLALGALPLAVLAVLAESFSPMNADRTLEFAVVGLGVLGILIGEALLLRIVRADPEPDQGAWRYRDF